MYLSQSKLISLGICISLLTFTCLGLLIYVITTSKNNAESVLVNTTEPRISEHHNTYPWEISLRLPSDVIPNHYSIYLHPDLESDIFVGNTSISVSVTANNKSHIWLHASLINISEVIVYFIEEGKEPAEVNLIDAFPSQLHQFWVLEFLETVQPGNYTFNFKFTGNLSSEELFGFYKSFYWGDNGQKRYLATTQMEPTFARNVFPCFDEPGFKANFSITLVRPEKDYIALSNMPVQEERYNTSTPGLVEVLFQPTVPMSTYLVAFIVCDFPSLKNKTQNGINFTTYAPRTEVNKTAYALSVGITVLNYYEDFFQVKYPLPKQDMIVIPDFGSGAMENWGLITFRETSLPYDVNFTSDIDMENVARTVAHELTHMWFGNLVTLKWWSDLWLNEGFASYITYKGVGKVQPDWDMESQFLTSDLHVAMSVDYQNSSHPIVQDVSDPRLIRALFDSISYSKGASVLRMLEHVIGSDQFRAGLKSYLIKYQYQNTITQDLWNELQLAGKSTKFNLTQFMTLWTTQTGYPVISVTKHSDSYIIQQDIFYISPEEEQYIISKNKSTAVWDIFITYNFFPVTNTSSYSENVNSVWLFNNETKKVIPKSQQQKTIKLNIEQYGYFRVNYDKDTWKELTQILLENMQVLSPSDRANLLDDVFTIAESGLLKYSVALNLSTYLKQEKHLVPWKRAAVALLSISNKIWNQPFYAKWQEYLVSLVNDFYIELGWEDSGNHLQKLTRTEVFEIACSNGHRDCVNKSAELFSKWINDEKYFIPPNFRNLVYYYGMASIGTITEWDIMFERYKTEQMAEEKLKLLYGLSGIKEPWILERYAQEALSQEFIRYQDMFTVIDFIGNNPIGNGIVWDYIRNKWLEFGKQTDLVTLGKQAKSITYFYNTESKLMEVQDFLDHYKNERLGHLKESASLRIQSNILWLNRSQTDIQNWLETYGLKYNA